MRVLVLALALGSAAASSLWSAALPPVVVHVPPRRIVSVALSADEILVDLVPHERIVGLTVFVDDPSTSPVSRRAPRAAARVTGEPEALLALAPDIVFASAYTRPEAVSLLTGAGIPVVGIGSLTTFDEVLASVTTLGDAVGEPERAREIVTGVRARIDAVVSRPHAGHARVLLWDGGFTYGTGTLEDEILRLAGAVNVAAEQGLRGPSALTEEAVVAFDPDVVLVPIHDESPRPNDPQLLGGNPVWSAVGAAKRGDVFGVPRAWIGCVSHHAVRALEAVARILDGRST